MNFNTKILQDLDDIIDSNLDISLFPYAKGNSIRIGGYAIRRKQHNYVIFNCKENSIVTNVFSKTSAIALAKNLSKGNDSSYEIQKLDNIIEKNYTDCLFYKHSIKTTSDDLKREVARTRYQVAKEKTLCAEESLKNFIFIDN